MPHGYPQLAQDETPTAEEDVVYSDKHKEDPEIRILHYNDIYHPDAQSEEPAGGAGRFQTLCNYYRDDKKFKDQPKLITVFSGDAYNPSTESAVTRGSHMVPILNNIGTDIACAGNHDFDFGAAQFEKLQPKCEFPWVLSNVLDPSEGKDVPLGHCHKTYIWEASNGIKIGFMGLAEREWAEKGNSLPQNLEYTEMIDAAEKFGPELRKQGADIVIAMTHARQPRDFAFGEGLSEGCVDIILAGHDHWWEHKIFDNGTHLLRSGSDFKMLSYVKAWKNKDCKGRWDFEIIRRYVVRSIEEHQPTLKMAEETMEKVRNKMERPIGYTITALEARDSIVKTRESNFANFTCDLMRLYYSTDVALMTGATIKGDQVHTPGMVRLKFITDSFPFEDAIVVVRITGKALWQALENGLHEYPDKENGIFLQVSGMRYTFNPNAEPWKRVQSVQIGDNGIELDKKYTVACRARMGFGQGKHCIPSATAKTDRPTRRLRIPKNGLCRRRSRRSGPRRIRHPTLDDTTPILHVSASTIRPLRRLRLGDRHGLDLGFNQRTTEPNPSDTRIRSCRLP